MAAAVPVVAVAARERKKKSVAGSKDDEAPHNTCLGESKFVQGKGLFATRDFAAGDIVFQDVVLVESEEGSSVHVGDKELGLMIVNMVKKLMSHSDRDKIQVTVSKMHATHSNLSFAATNHSHLSPLEQECWAKFKTNGVLSGNKFYIGKYAHMINHSCGPNLHFETTSIDPTTHVYAELYADCDIKKGEELTWSYSCAEPWIPAVIRCAEASEMLGACKCCICFVPDKPTQCQSCHERVKNDMLKSSTSSSSSSSSSSSASSASSSLSSSLKNSSETLAQPFPLIAGSSSSSSKKKIPIVRTTSLSSSMNMSDHAILLSPSHSLASPTFSSMPMTAASPATLRNLQTLSPLTSPSRAPISHLFDSPDDIQKKNQIEMLNIWKQFRLWENQCEHSDYDNIEEKIQRLKIWYDSYHCDSMPWIHTHYLVTLIGLLRPFMSIDPQGVVYPLPAAWKILWNQLQQQARQALKPYERQQYYRAWMATNHLMPLSMDGDEVLPTTSSAKSGAVVLGDAKESLKDTLAAPKQQQQQQQQPHKVGKTTLRLEGKPKNLFGVEAKTAQNQAPPASKPAVLIKTTTTTTTPPKKENRPEKVIDSTSSGPSSSPQTTRPQKKKRAFEKEPSPPPPSTAPTSAPFLLPKNDSGSETAPKKRKMDQSLSKQTVDETVSDSATQSSGSSSESEASGDGDDDDDRSAITKKKVNKTTKGKKGKGGQRKTRGGRGDRAGGGGGRRSSSESSGSDSDDH